MPPALTDSPANSAANPLSDTNVNSHVGKAHISPYESPSYYQAATEPSGDGPLLCVVISNEKKEPKTQSQQEADTFIYNISHFERNLSIHATPDEAFISPVDVISTSFTCTLDAQSYSSQFPVGHMLNPHFIQLYQLLDELGSGSYGFVMTACHRAVDHEVAVKFIIKANIPDYAWVEDEVMGSLPTEVALLYSVDHENVIKCIDFFEDGLYFYLVQELHGSPWHHDDYMDPISSRMSTIPRTPSLSPSTSEDSLATSDSFALRSPDAHDLRRSAFTVQSHNSNLSHEASCLPASPATRPDVHRRPSYDLFECIEQSEFKRLTVDQARYVFFQVVEAVYYLDSQGITHRDIKDENIVIDKNLKAKLIDFGSAVAADPDLPRPFYKRFYGTTAYAAPEILLKQSYQAPPAEVWTLGVLLSYLLTGAHPFPTVEDATEGKFALNASEELPECAINLMRRCLDPNPRTRATIKEIKNHDWLSH